MKLTPTLIALALTTNMAFANENIDFSNTDITEQVNQESVLDLTLSDIADKALDAALGGIKSGAKSILIYGLN
jgi:hypothetical protein